MKKVFVSCLFAAIVCLSCTKKEEKSTILVVKGMATHTGSLHAESNAIGAISGGYSVQDRKLIFNISWANLESQPTGTTFYTGQYPDSENQVLFPVTEGNTSGLTAGELHMTNEQANDLLSGKWMYTINSRNHPNGELIGSIIIVR